jgi:hypothetical protein
VGAAVVLDYDSVQSTVADFTIFQDTITLTLFDQHTDQAASTSQDRMLYADIGTFLHNYSNTSRIARICACAAN